MKSGYRFDKARIGMYARSMCKITGCERTTIMARGMCSLHYKRWYKYGDAERPNTSTVGLTLEEKLNKIGWVVLNNGCWEWQGRKVAGGYGQLDWQGKNIIASRAAYLTWRGDIPSGLFVCHTCDNRLCICPEHLWLGSNADNMADMVSKKRARNGATSSKGGGA